jgi:hypothetical protein
MDDRKNPISLHTLHGRTDADAAPIDSVCEGSSVIYFGDARRIGEGFAIALGVMGVEAPADLAPPNPNPNRENN